MKLTFEQIRSITHGAAQFLKEEDGIHLRRLTDGQFAAYYEDNPSIGHTYAGIKLVFRTDSRHLGLKAFIEGEAYYWPLVSFDIQVDGNTIDHLDNFSHIENFVPKFDENLARGEFAKTFDLGDGEKTVTVHLPWSQRMLLQEVALDDGAVFEPVHKKKLLLYGDSITQGYCAMRPSRRMAAYLAAALDMEECNRAMAGSVFLPQVAACRDVVSPDLITIAYGINDWYRGNTAEAFYENCSRFLENLRRNHPAVPIFVISPICCMNPEPEKPHCVFTEISRQLRLACQNFAQVTFISGEELMPRDESLFFDGLHPNDKGMKVYAENLIAQLKLHL